MTVKISNVNMKDGSEKIKVESPYYPEFPQYARQLGGKWNSAAKAWYFDPRDEDSVRDLCKDCFGTDGSAPVDLVDVRVTLDSSDHVQQVWRFGRKIARRQYRDDPVRLGDGVILVEGEFTRRGGSVKYPIVDWKEESVTLEIRDVPRSMVDENVEIVADNPAPVNPDLAYLRDALKLDDEDIIAAALAAYRVHVEKELA